MRRILWITSIAVTLFSSITYGETLSYTDLIGRLTDLERLAVLPAPGENCGQWSSYDRASQYNTATEHYQRWEANGDGEGIIRKEGNRLVLAEMTGPGCIWRIWSAMPKEGHILFYLDGSETPAIDIPFAGLFNRTIEPFTRPALVHETAKGQNCYIPIPYQKSCKIVVEGEWGRFYHFTYATYPKDTIVPTFSMKLSAEESAALDKADEILAKCGSPLEAMAKDGHDRAGRIVHSGDGWAGGGNGVSREDRRGRSRRADPRCERLFCRLPGTTKRVPPYGRRWGISSAQRRVSIRTSPSRWA